MTRKEFLAKYPKPWRFERTDRSGAGIICDKKGRALVILHVDYDWAENDDEKLPEPVFCVMENERGNADIVGPQREERDLLVSILMGGTDG